jgi:hypothetical protein
VNSYKNSLEQQAMEGTMKKQTNKKRTNRVRWKDESYSGDSESEFNGKIYGKKSNDNMTTVMEEEMNERNSTYFDDDDSKRGSKLYMIPAVTNYSNISLIKMNKDIEEVVNDLEIERPQNKP